MIVTPLFAATGQNQAANFFKCILLALSDTGGPTGVFASKKRCVKVNQNMPFADKNSKRDENPCLSAFADWKGRPLSMVHPSGLLVSTLHWIPASELGHRPNCWYLDVAYKDFERHDLDVAYV